ncbi:MAG: alpha/beta hydrolase fold domain-containing protein [Bryobacteraceae bacterium]
MRAICLFLAGLAAAAQTPGRKLTTLERIEPAHLAAVREARQRFAAARRPVADHGVFQDYRAALHVHAEDAPHTLGTRAEALAAARAAGVRVVLFSDHDGAKPDAWRGLREGVLFIPGGELGSEHILQGGGLRFLSHSEEALDQPTASLDGMEIYNRHADTTDEKAFIDFFRAALKDPAQWARIAAAAKQYPDEFFGAHADYWPAVIAKWDRDSQQHRLTGIAANDAHHNQRYQGLDLDPYEVSFRNVSTHILAEKLAEEAVVEALRSGRAYVAHDWLADPTGFVFGASNNLGIFTMGDSVPLSSTTRVVARLPLEAQLRLFRNGAVIDERRASELNFTAKEPGAYRVEAWLGVDGEERPWIYSNAVYLEAAKPAPPRPATISDAVELAPGLPYIDDGEAKHKLDVYAPKGKRGVPVFFFVHGGAWRSGDRALYRALGNRFASNGIAVVAPSYRLAPKNPHPAQIEDVAAAFAWTVRHIERHGGDPGRIFIGGHSAGGHLVALLALDPRYLARHELTPAAIRGVAALSGVYDVRSLSLFPDGAQASPLTYVRAGAPPFLVTYCQWDYYMLPAQARRLDAALRQAGVASQLVYVPRESHISEITNIWKPEDATARAVLAFLSR